MSEFAIGSDAAERLANDLEYGERLDDLSANLRTFAEQSTQNKLAIDALGERLDGIESRLEEAEAGVNVTDRSIKWAHERINNTNAKINETDEDLTKVEGDVEMCIDDIVMLDERTLDGDIDKLLRNIGKAVIKYIARYANE